MPTYQEPPASGAGGVTVELTPQEAGQFRKVAAEIAGMLPYGTPPGPEHLDDPELLAEIEVAARWLPPRLARALSRFRRRGDPHGTLIVRNVPLDDDLPPTPADGAAPDWSRLPLATVAQLAAVSWLGDVIAYADEKAGGLVQDVVPVRGAERRQENTGSVMLELHTEDGFHPYKPDFVTLLCLRADHERRARTTYGAITRALPRLSAECVRVLRRPLFRIRHSSSFRGPGAGAGAGAVSPPLPVLSGPAADPELVADFHAMEPMDETAARAFDELREAMLAVLVGTVLEAGDLIVVDNRAAVHGRTDFRPRYDGRDRWLRRCFAVADLRLSRGVRAPGSQVCAPLRPAGGP
ncbi:L-asparagine oxygenase [Streptomyces sulfonofaciens]|uniref:L-asparagine oxygenase n=1 Tax=Streptomyces sulfonofaciens TaxID=68272 RepID=A0A919L8Q3_9ACTN|nr:TauD/TfdA family dioxygenase [Streptomyces sulfonofaciens]GHH88870.1 L-asparagine oxygenase [Streptomyces sulfonofaciens]